MPLSRLQNFLRNPQGRILYVDSNNFDATDDYTNRGDSLTRPFFSLQRALIEAAAFSYQSGVSNDRNDKTTIIVYPGEIYIDNRPGLSITNNSGVAQFKKKTDQYLWEEDLTGIQPFGPNTNFDIFDENNVLYKFNSTEGGVILPRGTSIVGLDLRKTKIKPLYVPDPEDDTIDRSSIFKITGNCYFTAFTFFDADQFTPVYKNYTTDKVNPNYSHHKLTAFTYADGLNKVKLGYEQTDLTDLQMYYYKVAEAYNSATGRNIPDFPENNEISPVVDEYRIVGLLEENLLGISSIRSGDGLGGGLLSEITVTTSDLITKLPKPHNLSQYTQFSISGVEVSPQSYNGTFFVKNVINENTFTYTTTNAPPSITPLPSTGDINNSIIKVESDTVSSSSPYIFNCSLRSVYGMCGLWADGAKADGFKSVVVAQFTGVSLQKDDNAFILYNGEGSYVDNTTLASSSIEKPLHTNSKSIYKPSYESFHIRVSNNGFIQCVSIFAIGYAKHFVTESGGDMSITNSNSNFGAVSLESSGFRNISFDRDDVGYITHIIPPREIIPNSTNISWLSLDTNLIATSGITSHLYLYGYKNKDVLPPHKIDGYRIGAKLNDILKFNIPNTPIVYTSPILMPTFSGNEVSSKKEYIVGRTGVINAITSGETFTFTTNHELITGEKVRVSSDTGELPDGITPNNIYYAIRISTNSIKLAYSFTDAIATIPVAIKNIGSNGGVLKVISSVTDKLPGDIGHPIQYSDVNQNWYVCTSSSSTNEIRTEIVNNLITIGPISSSTFVTREIENRSIEDRLYKLRYVIPKEYINAREPEVGFIIQESKSVGVTTTSNDNSSNLTILDGRNEKVISTISAGAISNNSQTVTATTEIAHNFIVGDKVKLQKIRSSLNPNAIGITSSFNGTYEVLSTPDFNTFTYRISGVSTNPGTFTNTVNTRINSTDLVQLPTVSREEYANTFFVYRIETVRNHIPGESGQDGVYHLTVLTSNVTTNTSVGYGLSYKKFNQDVKNLYPQTDRDNFVLDPNPSVSFADYSTIGKVITNDKRNSITKEALNTFIENNRIGFKVTGISISGVGNTTITISTDIEHKLNSIKRLTQVSAGSGYNDSYNSIVILNGINTDATCGFTTSTGGSINFTNLRLTNPGSAFTTGQTITIQGGNNDATYTISEINNNINDGLELTGFFQEQLNGVFEITSIPNSKQVIIHYPKGLSSYTPNTDGSSGMILLSSDGVGITSFIFNNVSSGIVTVTTSTAHGLSRGNKFTIVGSGHTIYDKDFIVNDIVGLTTFSFNVGVVTQTATSTTGRLFKRTISSNGETTGRTGENLASRASYIYAGISTTLTSLTSTQITLTSSAGFNRGDYIQIGPEICRLTSNSTTNTFNVSRGLFGTFNTTHTAGDVVKKIKIIPVELRRPSFMRASGHTFEYLGYGPGNYSTAIPQKQNRKLTDDDILVSQSREISGGTVVYSGMNDLGEFYSGSKKYNSASGTESTVEAPIITFTGDDADGSLGENQSAGVFDTVLVSQRLTVEGGPSNDQSSIFYGPLKIENKTTTSSLSIKSKNFSLDDTTSNNAGDISYVGINTQYIGRINVNGEWRPWGLISSEVGSVSIAPDNITTGNLTVNGTTQFTGGATFGSATLSNLNVTGIATIRGSIRGTPGVGIVTFADTINAQLGVVAAIGSSFVGVVSTSDIVYGGSGTLNIQSTNPSGSITIGSTNPKNSSIFLDNTGTIVSTANTTGNGALGSHLSIFNSGSGDSILSWRNASEFWFSGIDTINLDTTKSYGNNSWKLGYSNGTNILSTNFNSSTTKVGVSTNGDLFVSGNVNCSNITTNNIQILSVNGGPLSGHKNRIINGDMLIAQRYGATPRAYSTTDAFGLFGGTTADSYVVDRWAGASTNTNTMVFGLNADTPPGYVWSHNVSFATGIALQPNTFNLLLQQIEGYNVTDFAYGTSAAITSTLSFYAKAYAAGVYGGSIRNGNANRSYPFTYVIDTPNVWQHVSITIPGDTTGTWSKTSGVGLSVIFDFGTGTTFKGAPGIWHPNNYVGATGTTVFPSTVANSYVRITGVQLEPGPVATPFEILEVTTRVNQCFRYYYNIGASITKQRYASGPNAVLTTEFYFPISMARVPNIWAGWANGSNAIAQPFANIGTRGAIATLTSGGPGEFSAIIIWQAFNAEL